ncbi:PTS sugar transporter subunit IIA [Sulfitobacter sp. S190]|uniref:PTS sugar transporter subunit IIA n=1 Tax=Sulfitobacter sp. S190 TaxID=2867022 RepID=UPI0021A58F32|nr:PTS sugar transporter subunit IIA [Sulfitobacter sp. S190]UWR22528.1 PTS sugar transporter subunit IIA [Sulfitobacter sp. S190]
MNFAKLLKPEGVKVLTACSSKKRLLSDLADLAEVAYDLPSDRVVEALISREALGPTGVGHGVALPHARLPDLTEVVGLFVLLERPVDFGAIDRQPVDIAFALLAPENAGVEHLKALALVSRTLRDPAICSKLRANPSAQTLYTILTEAETVKAA